MSLGGLYIRVRLTLLLKYPIYLMFVYIEADLDLIQYYKACYVPGIFHNKSKIQGKIVELYEIIQPIIATISPPIESYVVDFGFDETLEKVRAFHYCG